MFNTVFLTVFAPLTKWAFTLTSSLELDHESLGLFIEINAWLRRKEIAQRPIDERGFNDVLVSCAQRFILLYVCQY